MIHVIIHHSNIDSYMEHQHPWDVSNNFWNLATNEKRKFLINYSIDQQAISKLVRNLSKISTGAGTIILITRKLMDDSLIDGWTKL